MKIGESSWPQIERYLEGDDRAVIPLGSTEQHAQLSLCVDNILASRVAAEAAEPLGVPVFPVLSYGLTPYFGAYPGTVSLRLETYTALLGDILASLRSSGFRRILFVNGHGGNSAGSAYAIEWMAENPDTQVKWHNWWNAPRTGETAQGIDPDGSHASWMENFPWTRLPREAPPEGKKEMVDLAYMRLLSPEGVREYLGDGNMGGEYQKADETMLELWRVGVEETRSAIEGPWRE